MRPHAESLTASGPRAYALTLCQTMDMSQSTEANSPVTKIGDHQSAHGYKQKPTPPQRVDRHIVCWSGAS